MSFDSGIATLRERKIARHQGRWPEPFVNNRLAALGPITQLAYVPRDFDTALRYWTRTMGVGPFFTLDHISYREARYRGRPTQLDFSMALAYWGDVQIELIRQHDDAPSIYTDWLRDGREGVHHVCLIVDDISRARATCAAADAAVLQELFLDGAEAIYVAPGGTAGMMVEILQPSPAILDMFAVIREAARGWDGSEPVRSLG